MMSEDRYAILVGHEVRTCNMMTWARWLEATSETPGERGMTSRHVGDDEIGGLRVSTVFLGMDHQFGFGPPLWFETLVFGGKLDGLMQRYTTWEQAEAGHEFVKGRRFGRGRDRARGCESRTDAHRARREGVKVRRLKHLWSLCMLYHIDAQRERRWNERVRDFRLLLQAMRAKGYGK